MKPELMHYRTRDGSVRIGGSVFGVGAEVDDPDGWLTSLLGLLDGTASPAEVAAKVTARHPDVSEREVADALSALCDAGYVDDAGAPVPAQLSARDVERHSRGVSLLRWMDRTPRAGAWEVQARLHDASVLLVGVGGAGSFAAQALVASGVGRVHCIDPDVVELSNLNRQVLYQESDVGRPKAEAAVARLRGLNSDVRVTGERRGIDGEDDLAALLGPDVDLLVLSADRPRALWSWTNRACLAAGTPWVTGSYHGPNVVAAMFAPGRGACWECLRAYEEADSDSRLPDGVSLDDVVPSPPLHAVNAVSAGMCGSFIAHAAVAALTGVPPLEPGVRFGLNLVVAGDPILGRAPRDPACPACGDGQSTR
ncbi:MAG: ThiF family adenylyltransferase [Streptomycetaceae bacterium]|nr:ThiF family adenylyltransferase [Streptomycetaceae bacterium]